MDDFERWDHRMFGFLVPLIQELDGPLLDLSPRETLDVFLYGWVGIAQTVPEQRARLVDQLRHLAELLETKDPDRVMARLSVANSQLRCRA